MAPRAPVVPHPSFLADVQTFTWAPGLQATISRLEAAVADQARAHGGSLARSASGLGAVNGVVRPFDAQREAIGDRRYLGMYDARFHSTHRCAWCTGCLDISCERF